MKTRQLLPLLQSDAVRIDTNFWIVMWPWIWPIWAQYALCVPCGESTVLPLSNITILVEKVCSSCKRCIIYFGQLECPAVNVSLSHLWIFPFTLMALETEWTYHQSAWSLIVIGWKTSTVRLNQEETTPNSWVPEISVDGRTWRLVMSATIIRRPSSHASIFLYHRSNFTHFVWPLWQILLLSLHQKLQLTWRQFAFFSPVS